MVESYENLFVWKNEMIEDVRFWCEPRLTLDAIKLVEHYFSLESIDAFVGIESRGFYLAGAASVQYGRPTIMVRKHKAFFDKMDHETVHFKNWKGDPESLTVMKDSVPDVTSALVIDDILDTGASLRATQELLARLGIHVSGPLYLLNSYGDRASQDFGIPIKSAVTRKLFT